MKKFVIFLSIILIICFFVVLYFFYNLQGVCRNNCFSQVFVIETGSGLNQVLEKLEKEKIIRSAAFGKIYLKLTNFNGKIQAGDFKLNPSNSFSKIIATLQKGTLDFWVTIPEGLRAEQVWERVERERGGSATVAQYDGGNVNIYKKEEGYLFPDTYLIPRNANDKDVVKIMTNNNYEKVNTLHKIEFDDDYKKNPIQLNNKEIISVNDLMILASLVEREAKTDEERPIIAGIIYKRWKADWPLQICATVQYALGTKDEWWKEKIYFEDLEVESLYNTYKNKGLPPGPISNPGLKAIKAVIYQKQTPYWFYITGNDGVTRYSEDLSGHDLNVEKFINK